MRARRGSLTWTVAPLLSALESPVAQGAEERAPELIYEVRLDMDGDGKMDRAMLMLVNATGEKDTSPLVKDRYFARKNDRIDLHIHLGVGEARIDPSRAPDFVKRAVVDPAETPFIEPIDSKGRSLVINAVYGWGASVSWGETLTIVRRGGRFLAAGFTKSWYNRSAEGRCDLNFLSGKGVLTEGARKRPVKGRFKPVPVEEWSRTIHAKACSES